VYSLRTSPRCYSPVSSIRSRHSRRRCHPAFRDRVSTRVGEFDFGLDGERPAMGELPGQLPERSFAQAVLLSSVVTRTLAPTTSGQGPTSSPAQEAPPGHALPKTRNGLSAPATSKPSARTAGSRLPRARQMPPMAKPAMCPARGAPLAHGGAVLSPPRRTPGGHASRSRSPGQADETVTFGSVPIVLQAELRFAGSGFKSLATHPY
jgi:hypothetical protein